MTFPRPTDCASYGPVLFTIAFTLATVTGFGLAKWAGWL